MNNLSGPRVEGVKTPITPTGKNWRNEAPYIRRLDTIEKNYSVWNIKAKQTQDAYKTEMAGREKETPTAIGLRTDAQIYEAKAQQIKRNWNTVFQRLPAREQKKALKWAKKIQ